MKAGDVAERDRIATGGKHNWDCRSRRPGSDYGGVATGRCEHRYLALNQLGRKHRQAIVLTICVPIYDPDILVRGVAGFPEPIMKGRQHVRCTSGRSALEEPNHWHRELLRARRERPRRRAAEQCDERPPFHSITSSARASSVAGTIRPSALAVVKLMTRSNLVGCSTGMSAGFTPRRILST